MGWAHIMAIFSNTPEISHVAWSVLQVLAKLADGAGECWPSVSYLVEKTKLSERSVQNGIGELVESRLVEKESGRGNRHVNHYRLTERVINISTGVQEVHPSKVQEVHLSDGEGCRRCTLKVQEVHLKGAPGAPGRIHKEDIKHIVSLSPPSAGSAASPEELLVKQGAMHAELPPSAAGNDGVEYGKLIKRYGWKPSGRKALEAVVNHCYFLGADLETAKSFVRYNSIRRWNAVCDSVNVHMLAREWIRVWQYKTPDGFAEERSRRIEAKRASEEARLGAIVRAEEEAERQKGK